MIEMTEAEWMTTDTDALLRRVGAGANERRLRLFACACCRQTSWHNSRVEVSEYLLLVEQHSDGVPDNHEREYMERKLKTIREAPSLSDSLAQSVRDELDHGYGYCGSGVVHRGQIVAAEFGYAAAREAGFDATDRSRHVTRSLVYEDAKKAAREQQAPLVRDIFGRSYHKKARVQNRWRTSTAVGIALQMYDSRNFNAMPILADALQDAGCNDETILSHCRSAEPHVRGCWVVDLVLGKK
jgi:hypothetical protein